MRADRFGADVPAGSGRVMKRVLELVCAISLVAGSALGNMIHVPGDAPTIQDGIRAAGDGDTVLVAPGTYVENINFRGKNIVVASHFILDGDQHTIETTVIDGSSPDVPDSASCIIFCSGEDAKAVLQGFTLTGGTGTRWYDDLHSLMYWRAGGGILTYKSSPTVRDNIITGNAVLNTANVGGAQGGGLLCYHGFPQILDNIFDANEAYYGAGIVTDYSGAFIRGNVISRNTARLGYGGGGYYAIGNGPGPITWENNTIVDNSSQSNGGAMTLYGAGIVMTARNNIIWGNTQNQGGQITGNPVIEYSDVEGGFPGTGNIDIDPLFENDDFDLSPNSPCIDAGDPDSPLDPDGTRADMGARTYDRFDAPLIRIAGHLVDDSQGNDNNRADGGETVNLIVTCSNSRLDAAGVAATLSTADPDVQILKATADFGALPMNGQADNGHDPLTFTIDPTSVAHPSIFHLAISAAGGYAKSHSFEIIIGTSTVLCVDDDGGNEYQVYSIEALETQGNYAEVWNVALKGLPPGGKLESYQAVIWLTGEDRETSLTAEEQEFLAGFLEGGGNLILSGSNIGYDLAGDGSPADAAFFADYLQAQFISDGTAETFLYGVDGDPITGQYDFLPIEDNLPSPDVIAPLGSASTILTYSSTGQTAGIRYSDGYKLVYFAAGLENIGVMGSGSDVETRGTILQNCLNWFTYVPTAGDVNQDGKINILDVLTTINIILNLIQPTPDQQWAADCNSDIKINVLDALGIVNVVLGIGQCGP